MQHTTIISSDNPKRLPFCPSPPAHINGAVVVTGGGNNMRRPLCSNDLRKLSLWTISRTPNLGRSACRSRKRRTANRDFREVGLPGPRRGLHRNHSLCGKVHSLHKLQRRHFGRQPPGGLSARSIFRQASSDTAALSRSGRRRHRFGKQWEHTRRLYRRSGQHARFRPRSAGATPGLSEVETLP